MKVINNINYVTFDTLSTGDLCKFFDERFYTTKVYMKIPQSFFYNTPSPNYTFNAVSIEDGDRIWIDPCCLVMKIDGTFRVGE